jgi:hypothetical protein
MLTMETVRAVAESRGGKLLSKTYHGTRTKLQWQCVRGHIFFAFLGNARTSWCPVCRSPRSERIVRVHFEHLFRKPFPKCRPRWLRAPSGRLLELDGYCEELKLAFEHQGLQHYRAGFFSDNDALTSIARRDRLKAKLCRRHGVSLVIVPQLDTFTSRRSLGDFIANSCRELGVRIPSGRSTKGMDLSALYVTSEDELLTQSFQQLAAQKGGKCLSLAYAGIHEPLLWQCGACTHVWSASPNSIRRGSWCPRCARKTHADSIRHDLKDMHRVAKSRGGRCLSASYISLQHKLEWQCGKCGHRWFAKGSNVMSGGWCPPCGRRRAAEKKRVGIVEMRAMAKSRGGKCLSDEYVSLSDKLEWQCGDCGHQWFAKPGNIRAGSWCPPCARRRGLERISAKARVSAIKAAATRRKNSGFDPVAELRKLQAIARSRGGECLSRTYVTTKTGMRWKCGQCDNIWSATAANVTKGTWCRRCSSKRAGRNKARYSLSEMRLIAKQRGGECLSSSFDTVKDDLEWKCGGCSHTWTTSALTVIKGSWCPRCARARSTDAARNKGSVNARKSWASRRANSRFDAGVELLKLEALAKSRGGQCLSREYVTTKTKMQWKCGQCDNVWSAMPASIRRGSWCPRCAVTNRRRPD